MSIKSFYTSYFDSLSDLKSRHDFKQELKTKLIEDNVNNLFEGKRTFRGVVLQIANASPTATVEQTKSGNFVAIKVRIEEIHGKTLPEPCDESAPDKIQEIVDMHPTAFSEYKHVTNTPAVGDTVECYYLEQGPQFEGAQRGLRFRDSTVSRSPGHYFYRCLTGYQSTRTIDFFADGLQRMGLVNNQSITNLIVGGGKISNGKNIPGRINATWSQLKEFGKLGLLDNLLTVIAAKESRGDYNNFNVSPRYYSRANMAKNYGSDVLQAGWGKDLTELTIHQVNEQAQREYKLPRRVGGGVSYFRLHAVGKYQIIRGTLSSAILRISGCDTNELFNAEAQEAFGVYLLLMKKPNLGAYLLGDKNATAVKAQLAVAQEWAAMKIAATHDRKQKTRKDGSIRWDARRLVAGQGYYCGDGTHGCSINTALAQQLANALASTRQAIDNSPQAQEMIKKILGK